MERDDAIAELRRHSARWGGDPMLAQGPGGNTSYKAGGRMVVKASGFRLSEALERDIFVTLRLDDPGASPEGPGLRPSIETGFHAAMPHPFVAHLHVVEVIASALSRSPSSDLRRALGGLRWGWLPYLKPGAPLAEAVAALAAADNPDVIVLGNHGLVIGGRSCAEIDAVLADVRARLRKQVRGGAADHARLAEPAGRLDLEPVRFADAHLAATDPVSLGFAGAGSLYPDHVVFLGRGAATLGEPGSERAAGSMLRLVPGAGALLPRGAPVEAHEMAACLGAVCARIPADTVLATLTAADEDDLLDWDAEAYRRDLAAAAAAPRPGALAGR